MSFKRDGNDKNLLSILQRRRIKDLLAEDIPEKEAKLLSNGRFTCLVCSHHPIFDTVAMLSVHRQGKKHKSCEEIYKRKNLELAQLIIKRKQEQPHNASMSISAAALHHSGISASCPYDPRVQKHKWKRGDRRRIVDLGTDCMLDTHTVSEPNIVRALDEDSTIGTHSSASSSSTSHWHEVVEKQMKGPIKHDKRLKNIFRDTRNEAITLAPYQPKVRLKSSSGFMTGSNDCSSKGCLSDTDHPVTKMEKPIIRVPYGLQNVVTSSLVSSNQPSLMLESDRLQQISDSTVPLKVSVSSGTSPTLEESLQSSESEIRQGKRKKKNQGLSTATKKIASDHKSLADQYYHLQGSGWKKDWDGKWIKDEQAEFDSDEEPPDLP